jgi:hypothetical protein
MPEKWTGEVVGRMHVEKVTYTELGKKLGICKGYLCDILNSRREPKDIQQRVTSALDELIAERKKGA